jgi:hypothetical protein
MAARVAQALEALTQGRPLLTKANLERNNSKFANFVREQQALQKADALALALRALGEEIPERTTREIVQLSSGALPLKPFQQGLEEMSRPEFDVEAWKELVNVDPLAAELEAMCGRPHGSDESHGCY